MNASFESRLAPERPGPGLIGLAERGWIPDVLLRQGIRRLCRQRLREEHAGGWIAESQRFDTRLDLLRGSPIAIHADAANAQHYELPPEFFRLCLGARLKYSACFYPGGNESLDEAEDAMLALYGERAALEDHQDILELGCGWGSLTLWMAERYPNARITAVSSSAAQREHIRAQCHQRGFDHVRVITEDVNVLELEAAAYDRCVSVEMFEHMRNYATLMERISRWLRPGGMLFVHIFVHRTLMYPFETSGEDNWMGRHFFTGGLMPSADTLAWFQDHLTLDRRWLLDGRHYARTANHWLSRQDRHRDAVHAILAQTYGEDQAALWAQRWRMFWMACAEMFDYDAGRQWGIGHYRFTRPHTVTSTGGTHR